MTGLLAGRQDVFKSGRLFSQVMHGIGVVPENNEIIRFGFHVGQTIHDAVGIDGTGGIAVLGHTPDAFDTVIGCHQIFNPVHVGPVCFHINDNHFDSQRLTDRKMTVITGTGAQKFNLGQ